MPHGFECDRCSEFVNQGRPFPDETVFGEHGQEVERVILALEDDEDFQRYDWTLCETCKEVVVEVVEST